MVLRWVGWISKECDIMQNNRTLYPPLFKPVSSGGGGSGQTIQVTKLPEAVLAEKDKIYQYTGSTTETLTNGFFYKCVENTSYDWEETEASETYTEAETLPTASAETVGTIYKVDDKYYQTVIVLSYSWENIPVMEAGSSGGANIKVGEETPVFMLNDEVVYATLLKNQNPTVPYTTNSILNSTNIKELVKIEYNVASGSGAVLGFEKNIQVFGLTATQYYINSNGSGWTYPTIIVYYTKN